MSKATVIIVGGGVTGLSAAYHLALKNFGRIIVLEKGLVGDGSSRRAAGIITGLLWSETGIRVRKLALRRYRELSNELAGYRFRAVGCLNWFDRSSWADRQTLLPLYDRCGAPYEIVDSAEIRRRWPGMNPPEDVVGLFDPLGGYSEPDEYVPALANRCRQLGVEIFEQTAVESILVTSGRAAGVRTSSGVAIESDVVVAANFVWANHLLRSVGVQVPVKGFVHQRFVTRPLAESLRSPLPAVNANTLYGYFRPAAGNRLLVGIETPNREEWKVESPDFQMDAIPADAHLRDQLRNFIPVLPALDGVEWEYERSGLIMFSADNEPIVGSLPAMPGLYIGVAFHSGGFAYNPAMGMLLAEFVADGNASSADISAFSPQRFNAAETVSHLATTVQQKNAARRRH